MSQESFGPKEWGALDPESMADIQAGLLGVQAEAEEIMERGFYDNLAVFRAEFFQRLNDLHAMDDSGLGWAYFRMNRLNDLGEEAFQEVWIGTRLLEVSEPVDGDESDEYDEFYETAIRDDTQYSNDWLSEANEDGVILPNIRIFVNERVVDEDGDEV